MKNAKSSLGTTDPQNQLMIGSLLRKLLKRPKDCFLTTKYKKSLQKIDNLGTSWARSRSTNY